MSRYATKPIFNGQALSLGRVVLVQRTEEALRPYVVKQLLDNGFVVDSGLDCVNNIWYDQFTATPIMAMRYDGFVEIEMLPGQWCFPPRVP